MVMAMTRSRVDCFVKRALICFALAGAIALVQAGNFDASLQGQSVSNSIWQAGNLAGWQEMDLIPCRMFYSGPSASGQTITIEFDHTKTSTSVTNPGIQNLFYFTNSANVTFVSPPVLYAPPGVDTWSYTFIINYSSSPNGGWTEFRSRLSAGSHLFTGS